MVEKRDSLGFIVLDDLKFEKMQPALFSSFFNFIHNNKKYIFKEIKNIGDIYNELVAELLAYELKIPCVHYDIASYYDRIGVISENFINENDKYIPMSKLLTRVFPENHLEKYNNLEDITFCLRFIYKDDSILITLINELFNIFIFDMLIGNIDRHIENYGIIENASGIHFAKVFDNEKMLSPGAIENGIYSIGIDRSDYLLCVEDYYNHQNFLEKFLEINPLYKEFILEKTEIIKEENIEKILNRVEMKINAKIEKNIRINIKEKFKANLSMIEQILNKQKVYKK